MTKTTLALKTFLHALVNIGGNTALYDLLPADYKLLAMAVFNLIQVIYAFYDTSYSVHLVQNNQN